MVVSAEFSAAHGEKEEEEKINPQQLAPLFLVSVLALQCETYENAAAAVAEAQ